MAKDEQSRHLLSTTATQLHLVATLGHEPRYLPQKAPWAHNVAEHSHFVSYLVMLLLTQNPRADAATCLKMATCHDVHEVLTGDQSTVRKPFVQVDAEKATRAVLKNTWLEKEAMDLFQRYEARECLESRVVKAADILSTIVELKSGEAQGDPYCQRMLRISKVDRTREKLGELEVQGALDLFEQLLKTAPSQWHSDIERRYADA